MEIQELPGITRFIPKILLALTVTVCDEVYKKIAYWLNDMGKRHTMNSLGTLLNNLFMILIQGGSPLSTEYIFMLPEY